MKITISPKTREAGLTFEHLGIGETYVYPALQEAICIKVSPTHYLWVENGRVRPTDRGLPVRRITITAIEAEIDS